MSAHRFTSGTPQERRAWVSAIAAGMRAEAGSKYRVAAALERGARDLDKCDAEAGEIPIGPLDLALFECIDDTKVSLILGLPNEGRLLHYELRRLAGEMS
ncbi:MAG TPA: hypothetical protein VHS78_09390 [Candidatus Elarobacter sp.]|nr:hypothetical protein [Candidatus Elarobacter sp.]